MRLENLIGKTVRIVLMSECELVGQLIESDNYTLTLQMNDKPRMVWKHAVMWLEE
jgi:sRNA-binding regulator protein Hfq